MKGGGGILLHHSKMQITAAAKNKIESLLKDFPVNTYFSIKIHGNIPNGFNYSCFFDTSRSKIQNIPDAQVYMCVDPFIVTDYVSYASLFEKTFDYDETLNEFVIT